MISHSSSCWLLQSENPALKVKYHTSPPFAKLCFHVFSVRWGLKTLPLNRRKKKTSRISRIITDRPVEFLLIKNHPSAKKINSTLQRDPSQWSPIPGLRTFPPSVPLEDQLCHGWDGGIIKNQSHLSNKKQHVWSIWVDMETSIFVHFGPVYLTTNPLAKRRCSYYLNWSERYSRINHLGWYPVRVLYFADSKWRVALMLHSPRLAGSLFMLGPPGIGFTTSLNNYS